MSDRKDRILVIDPNANERDSLVEGTLIPYGYEVQTASDGGDGLKMILENKPDLLILDLKSPGLTAADLMAALNSQALDLPVVVLVDKGHEIDALHAFRLGVKDFAARPIRDAEVIQIVDRLMKDIRVRRDREVLVGEVKQASGEAEQRLREQRTLMSIGKAVTASRNLDEVFDRVIRAATQLTRAESVGFFLRDTDTNQLILRAGQNLSRSLVDKIGQPVADGIAPIVMNSKEVYVASGEGLAKFKPAQEGASMVIYAPLVVQDSVVGLLWVANAKAKFEHHHKDIMSALADYAAIAVVNAHLFNTMQTRTRQLEAMTKQMEGAGIEAGGSVMPISSETLGTMRTGLTHLMGSMNMFRTGEMGKLQASQQAATDVMHRELEKLIALLDELSPPAHH